MARFKRFIIVSAITVCGCCCVSNELDVNIAVGLFIGLLSLPFRTKEERKQIEADIRAKEEARKREEEARKSPGCHSMDNVDILTFRSSNNLLTAGNNCITMKIRNRNAYDVIVSVRFKYSDSEGWDSSTKSYEVGGNRIRTIDTLGSAWRKAKDVTIVCVH